MRQKKREVKIGNVTIGGSNPIAVQTMLNVPVEDIEGNVDRKSTRLNSSHVVSSRMPSSA